MRLTLRSTDKPTPTQFDTVLQTLGTVTIGQERGMFRDGDGIVSVRLLTEDEAQELGYDDHRKWVPGYRPVVATYADGQEFTYWVKEEAKG